jgi:hypothetical protein
VLRATITDGQPGFSRLFSENADPRLATIRATLPLAWATLLPYLVFCLPRPAIRFDLGPLIRSITPDRYANVTLLLDFFSE